MTNLFDIADEFIMNSINELRRDENFEAFDDYDDLRTHIGESYDDFIAYVENPNNGYRHLMLNIIDRKVKSFYVRHCNKAYKTHGITSGFGRRRICFYSDDASDMYYNILIATFANKYDKYERYLRSYNMVNFQYSSDSDEEDEEDEENTYNDEDFRFSESLYSDCLCDPFHCCVCLETKIYNGYECETCQDGKICQECVLNIVKYDRSKEWNMSCPCCRS